MNNTTQNIRNLLSWWPVALFMGLASFLVYALFFAPDKNPYNVLGDMEVLSHIKDEDGVNFPKIYWHPFWKSSEGVITEIVEVPNSQTRVALVQWVGEDTPPAAKSHKTEWLRVVQLPNNAEVDIGQKIHFHRVSVTITNGDNGFLVMDNPTTEKETAATK